MFRTLVRLRHPLAALGLCALLAQQVVGAVLTASPAMALESGFSLCLGDPPDGDGDPRDGLIGAGFCPCTMQLVTGILASDLIVRPQGPVLGDGLSWTVAETALEHARHQRGLPRAPPPLLHS